MELRFIGPAGVQEHPADAAAEPGTLDRKARR